MQKPAGFVPLATTSVLPSRSTVRISWAPQLQNQRRPSCHRGDSPTTRPLIRVFSSVITIPPPAETASALETNRQRGGPPPRPPGTICIALLRAPRRGDPDRSVRRTPHTIRVSPDREAPRHGGLAPR